MENKNKMEKGGGNDTFNLLCLYAIFGAFTIFNKQDTPRVNALDLEVGMSLCVLWRIDCNFLRTTAVVLTV